MLETVTRRNPKERYDFSNSVIKLTQNGSSIRYAVITEPGSKKTHEVCGATVRKTHVYESSGNIVDIQPLEGAAGRRRLFLLQYEGIRG